jgi:hypothetical protein
MRRQLVFMIKEFNLGNRVGLVLSIMAAAVLSYIFVTFAVTVIPLL